MHNHPTMYSILQSLEIKSFSLESPSFYLIHYLPIHYSLHIALPNNEVVIANPSNY
jgi:hypothetical protein